MDHLKENSKDKLRPSGNVKDRKQQTKEDSDSDDEFDEFNEEVAETKEFIANEAEKLAMNMDMSHVFNDIKLQFRLDTFEIRLYVQRRQITVHSEILPNWHMMVRGLCTYSGVEQDRSKITTDFVNPPCLVRNRITLREINIIDYSVPDSNDPPAFNYARSEKDKFDKKVQDIGKFALNKTAQNMHFNQPYDMNGRPTSAKGDVDFFRLSEK